MKRLQKRPPLVLLVTTGLVAVTLALASVAAGTLAEDSRGSAATVSRPAGAVEGVAPAEPRAAPLALPTVPAMAPPAEALPQPVYADWQINEMTARHPEP